MPFTFREKKISASISWSYVVHVTEMKKRRQTRQLTVKRSVNDWAQMVRNNPRID